MASEPTVARAPERGPFLTPRRALVLLGSLGLLGLAVVWAARSRPTPRCTDAALVEGLAFVFAGAASGETPSVPLPFAAKLESTPPGVAPDAPTDQADLCLDPKDRPALVEWFREYAAACGLAEPLRHDSYFGDLELRTPGWDVGRRSLRMVYRAETGWARIQYRAGR